MSTSVIQIRVDDELKKQADFICGELGIDLPTAIRMFLKRTVLHNGIPFSMVLTDRSYNEASAVRALWQLSEDARNNGTANMTLEEIDQEIEEVRSRRTERKI